MKLNSKLKAKIKDTFKANPDVKKLIVTTDGNCFLPQAKNHAVYHAHKKGLKWFEVSPDDLKPGQSNGEEKSTKKADQ